jgi:hypothetical protein
MTIKLKLKAQRITKNPRIRFDLEKLKDPEIVEVDSVSDTRSERTCRG